MNRARFVSLLIVLGAAAPLAAQPFNSWLINGISSSHGYVEIPSSSDFNFSTGFTFEAWISGTDAGGCSSVGGKNFTNAWWVGVCGTTLRSYIMGTPSQFNSGKISSDWTHIAVTYDGTTRKHYVDGELVGTRTVETGAMPTNTSAVRIDSDVSWEHSFGAIDEVRIWNVARTIDQIRSAINVPITSPQPGLVALYHLDANANDSIGGHNGALGGSGAFFTSPAIITCGSSSASALCLSGARFLVTAKVLLADGTYSPGHVVPGSSADSGLFWFFGPDNWELLVKVLDGCPLGGPAPHKWVFSAGTTDQHYSLIVTDVKAGQTKRYFNYAGTAAPAITDTSAFATCP